MERDSMVAIVMPTTRPGKTAEARHQPPDRFAISRAISAGVIPLMRLA